MKKVLAILLVALLTVSSVFAVEFTLGGEASTEFAYNLDAKTLGFAPTNKVTATLGATTRDTANEGDWYAVLKAKLSFKEQTAGARDFFAAGARDFFAAGDFKITEASLTNDDWTIGIISAAGVTDYAKSFEVDASKAPYSAATGIDTAKGITVSKKDLVTVGIGVDMKFAAENDPKDFSLAATLADQELADGMKLGVSAGVSSKLDLTAGDNFTKIGGGVKFAFDTDGVAVTVAADAGVSMDKNAKTNVFNMDAYANAKVSLVDATVYFSLEQSGNVPAAKWLSAKVVADLNDFEVPVTLTVEALNLINKQDLTATVKFAKDAVEVSVYGGFVIEGSVWKAGVAASYDIEDIGKLAAKVDVKDKDLKLSVDITNTTLVTGATLKAGYASENLLADPAGLGKIYASATIKF